MKHHSFSRFEFFLLSKKADRKLRSVRSGVTLKSCEGLFPLWTLVTKVDLEDFSKASSYKAFLK